MCRCSAGSRWAAGYLIRHPQLLDELLDDEAIASPFDWPAFKRSLRARLAAADGVEQQMDLLRHAHQAEVFRILLIDLRGDSSVEQVSDRLSELADAVLDVTVETVWKQLPKRHRQVPRFAVIAYGKLGGKELGLRVRPRCDLSLRRSRRRGLRHLPTFTRRLITWLTTATGAGTLFDIDLRLRPNGESGLLVTDLDSFRALSNARRRRGEYRMGLGAPGAYARALTARATREIGAEFEAIRATTCLTMPRDAGPLARRDRRDARAGDAGHPNRTRCST